MCARAAAARPRRTFFWEIGNCVASYTTRTCCHARSIYTTSTSQRATPTANVHGTDSQRSTHACPEYYSIMPSGSAAHLPARPGWTDTPSIELVQAQRPLAPVILGNLLSQPWPKTPQAADERQVVSTLVHLRSSFAVRHWQPWPERRRFRRDVARE